MVTNASQMRAAMIIASAAEVMSRDHGCGEEDGLRILARAMWHVLGFELPMPGSSTKFLLNKAEPCRSSDHSAGWYVGLRCTRCGNID